MARHLGQHAIVIGGSMAGLMTARVLADYFARVTILERDHIDSRPAVHKSIPQGYHIHLLLLGGQHVLASLYPGFTDTLQKRGAVRFGLGKDVAFYFPDGKAYWFTGSVREPRDFGLDVHSQSRGLLEHCVRQLTLAHANVSSEGGCTVQGLLSDHGRVCGVHYTYPGGTGSLTADLVVDAGGRGSHVPRWLSELGFQTPEESIIRVDFTYASTKFRIPDDYDEPERTLFFGSPAPRCLRYAAMEEIEERTWHLSLIGRCGETPPTDEDGFFAFARSLPTPQLYLLIKNAERISDIVQHRFPASIRRHYERLTTFPDGLLVLGDAICSFNPVYGQGMTAAALQVKALQQVLTEHVAQTQGIKGLACSFFPRAAEIITTPWTLAAIFDLAYPRTRGTRPPNLKETARYVKAVDALTTTDEQVHRLMLEVFQLTKPLAALQEEPLRSRVLPRQRRSVAA